MDAAVGAALVTDGGVHRAILRLPLGLLLVRAGRLLALRTGTWVRGRSNRLKLLGLLRLLQLLLLLLLSPTINDKKLTLREEGAGPVRRESS